MSWEAVGALLAVLVVVFIIGQIWFHLVEGMLGGLRRLFGKKEPTAWHPLPQAWEKKQNKND